MFSPEEIGPKGLSCLPYTVQKPQQLVYASMLFLSPQKATPHYLSLYQMYVLFHLFSGAMDVCLPMEAFNLYEIIQVLMIIINH